MEHGIVRDWNDMERIWQYVYSKDQLQTFSEEVTVTRVKLSAIPFGFGILLFLAACPVGSLLGCLDPGCFEALLMLA